MVVAVSLAADSPMGMPGMSWRHPRWTSSPCLLWCRGGIRDPRCAEDRADPGASRDWASSTLVAVPEGSGCALSSLVRHKKSRRWPFARCLVTERIGRQLAAAICSVLEPDGTGAPAFGRSAVEEFGLAHLW